MADTKINQGFSELKLKNDVVRWVTDADTYYGRRLKNTLEYVRRYKAKRSIAGLILGDDPIRTPKNSPWDNASDIGIPIEAFTIEGLLPRFLKVCYGSKPIVWVKGNTEEDHPRAPVVQDALNHQLQKKIKIYRRMKNCFKNVVMDGDGIAKVVWEEEFKIINRTVYWIQDVTTGEFLKDEQGNNVEVKKDDEIPIINEQTGFIQQKFKKILSEPKKIYDGPRIYSRNIRQITIPKDANTPEIDDLDWICDKYEKTLDWLKRNIGDIEEGKFEESAVEALEKDILERGHNTENTNHNFTKILIREWHGKYDVNDDGLDEEIVVFLGQKTTPYADMNTAISDSRLLGWMITPYPKRPFFHYQIIPMDGSFYGIGVPEFLIGIRNLIDATFNQMIDRGSIANNPPLIVPSTHDPDEERYGPGAEWVSDNPNAYRALQLPNAQQLEFQKVEFLLALVAKLFGVTDFVPPPNIGQQRTATGILTIVGETNIKFDDMIRALQDVNEDMYDFIVQLNADLLDDKYVFYLTGQENPFPSIKKEGFHGNFDFESAGNSININREIEQNRSILAYRTSIDSYGRNPAITDEIMTTVTKNLFETIDMRDIKVPTPEELQKRRIADLAAALRLNAEQAQQQAQEGKIEQPITGSPTG